MLSAGPSANMAKAETTGINESSLRIGMERVESKQALNSRPEHNTLHARASERDEFNRGGRKMVGAVRFELTTSCTRNKRATRLRYAPTQGQEKVPGAGPNCNQEVESQRVVIRKA